VLKKCLSVTVTLFLQIGNFVVVCSLFFLSLRDGVERKPAARRRRNLSPVICAVVLVGLRAILVARVCGVIPWWSYMILSVSKLFLRFIKFLINLPKSLFTMVLLW
jgi:hypothetical protein